MNLIPTLTADDADHAVATALSAAASAGIAVTIAVVDAAGNLLSLKRMHGARAFSIDLATRKARTAAAVGVGTGMLAQMYKDRPAPADLMILPGGVPALSGGATAGAVGVSGGPPDIDEKIAAAAVAVISPAKPD
ncbi:MAG: heme-binding protein [Devosia sp.]